MDYLPQLQRLIRRYLPNENLRIMAAEVTRCCQELASGGLLFRPLPWLQLRENDWWAMNQTGIQRGYTAEQIQHDFQTLQYLFQNLRRYLQYHEGQWTLISQQALHIWTHYYSSLRYLEIMAGNGRLAQALAARGQSVIATDSFAWRTENLTGQRLQFPVQPLSALSAVKRFGAAVDVILLSWSPNDDPIDWLVWEAIQHLEQPPNLLVIGERFGVTNSGVFWREARPSFSTRVQLINRYLPKTSDGVYEQLYLYRPKQYLNSSEGIR